MVAQKKNKKASPKKSRYSTNQTDPMRAFVRAEIVYENSDDLLGTVKFLDEKLDTFEKLEKFKKEPSKNKNFPLDSYLKLLKKFETAKDKKKLRFTDYDLKILEKALDLSIDHARLDAEMRGLRGMLAWANTAFKDEGYSYEKNLREAGRRLGFTKEAKKLTPPFHIPSKGKKRTYDPETVIPYYKKLIESGESRENAVFKCVKEFSFASNNACSQYLRRHNLTNIPTFRNIR